MSDKAKHLDTLFATWGIEKASEILEKEGVAALAARLAEAGHTAKATDELPVKDESETKPGADLAVLVTDLLEALGDYAGKVDAQATDIKALHDARQKAADEANAKIAALVEKVKALEEWKAQTPRASQDGPAPTPQQAEEFKKQDVDPVREFLFGKKG